MRHLLLRAQDWWDAQRFDQPEWHLAAWPDQKVRHIQLHVAKALGKVMAALDSGVDTASGIDAMARVRDEVLPDVAIYCSQLINTLQKCGVPTASLFRPHGRVPFRSAADPLFRVAMSLSRASAQLAAYIEPREHGAMSPASSLQEAIQDLHDSAEALASYFAVDLASAHQARLEALLGAPLPASLIERGREDP
ncbi:MAG TPA: hypothetical protein VGC99_04535 [Candidatus Tectomicrobia bacterium]